MQNSDSLANEKRRVKALAVILARYVSRKCEAERSLGFLEAALGKDAGRHSGAFEREFRNRAFHSMRPISDDHRLSVIGELERCGFDRKASRKLAKRLMNISIIAATVHDLAGAPETRSLKQIIQQRLSTATPSPCPRFDFTRGFRRPKKLPILPEQMDTTLSLSHGQNYRNGK